MARARKAKGAVKVNFKDVESRKTPPEGDYVVEVTDAQMGKSGNNNEQIEFTLEIAKGEFKGTKLWLYCPLQENSLWKLHAFLTALGQEVPEEEMEIDLPELIGEKCLGVITHDTYQGRKRAKLTDFDTLDNYKGDDDDGKKDKKSKKKDKGDKDAKSDDKGKSKKGADKGDDKKSSKKDKGKKDEPDAKSKKSKDKDDTKSDKKSKGKDDKKSKSKKPKKFDGDKIDDMDEDELQEVIDASGIDVDLDDFKKLPKKVAAVKDALEEADLLED